MHWSIMYLYVNWHINEYFQIHKVSVAETDTYKCFAANEYGKAVCTTTLTVTEGKTCPLNTFKDDSVLSFF